MSWWDVLILSIIQGLTEFLPVSSSGHLVLASELLQFDDPGVIFEIVLHLGTLVAVLLFYRDDLWSLIVEGGAFLRGRRGTKQREAASMIGWLVLATIPAALCGYLLGDRVEAAFEDPRVVCGALIFTGLLLLSTFLRAPGRGSVSVWRALGVGLWQVIALIPGVSRSGSTIAGGMLLGLRPEEATRFSFLMSIPVILGAGALKARELGSAMDDGHALHYLVGMVIAFLFGYLSIGALLRLVRSRRFGFFGIYCLLVGIVGLVYFSLR